jgi:hypothetical protein
MDRKRKKKTKVIEEPAVGFLLYRVFDFAITVFLFSSFFLSFFLLFRVIQVRVQHTKVVNSSTSRTGIEPAEMSYTLYARYAPSQKRRKTE